MKLRWYQEDAINLLKFSIGKHKKRRPILQVSTGAGKTVIAGEIIKMALAKSDNTRVAFIVPKIQLVDQASAHLDAIGIDHGVIQANHWRTNPNKRVQIISVQTLIRRKPWEFELGIVDECHHVFKGLVTLMTKKWNNIPFIGLSATPWTVGLGKIYDDLIIPVTIDTLIEEGYLVDAVAYGPSKPDLKGVKTQAGDYNQKQLGERTDTVELIADIVKTWKEKANGKPTICFAVNVAHSKNIAARFRGEGINAVHIDAYTDDDDRRRAIQQFKDHEVQVLTSVGVLHTGFDAPNAEVAILARPTASRILHIQMIGRVLRPYEGKAEALILDHAGNIERHGFHTDPTPTELDMGEKKDKVATNKEQKEKLPRPCNQCYFMIPVGIHKCPACGHSHNPANEVYETAGNLEKIQGRNNRKYSMHEKRYFFAQLLHVAVKRGYKEGWARHKYKEKFGVWPNAHQNVQPLPPEPTTMSWLKHRAIAWGNRPGYKNGKPVEEPRP